MYAKSSDFKYIERAKKGSIVLIPGWASDYRIFHSLDLEFNYLIPVIFSPFGFEESLLLALRENNIRKVSLFGWSLGGFLAQEFALKYPDLINELFFVSIRKKYKDEEIAEARDNLKKNKRAYLYKFYSQCFCKKDDMRRFRENLLKSYLEELELDYLLGALDYLAGSQMKPGLLRKIKDIKIIHGECDRIAPIKEAIEIKNNLPQATFMPLKDRGHIPFYRGDVSQ